MSPPKYVKHHKEQVLSKACAPALSALAGPHLTKGMTSLAEGDRGYGSELPCNWYIRSCKVYVRKNCETFVQINLINDICEPVDPGRFGSDVRLGQRYEDRSVSRATAKMTLSKTWKKQVLCNTYNNKNSFTIHTRFGTTFLAPPPTITMKLVLFFFLVLASSSLLVNAEYRWDQDAQEWVLVEDVSVLFDNLNDLHLQSLCNKAG